MRKSLTCKVFLITSLCFTLILGLVTLFTTVFIDSVHQKKEISYAIKSVNNFVTQNNKKDWTQRELYIKLIHTNINSQALCEIVDPKVGFGRPSKAYDDFQRVLFTVERNGNDLYDIRISKKKYDIAFGKKNIFNGDMLRIKGYIKAKSIIPIQINGVNLEYDKNITLDKSIDDIFYVRAISFDNKANYEVISDIFTKRNFIGFEYYISKSPNFARHLYYKRKIENTSGKVLAVQAIVILQPVYQTIKLIKEYYVYFYILALGVSLVMTFIYSRVVTNPLKKLSHSASRMANMDFSDNYSVNSEDELGILSKSLNTLSRNLNDALNQLKSANYQLKLDYEKELKQEKSRKEFVANVSHELKTPLGIIKGFAEGLKDGIKKDKRDYYIDVILDEVEKMNILILEMLELSKLEAGALKLKVEEFDLNKLVNKVADVFKLPVSDKGLVISISGLFNNVIADKSKIEQVIINLVGNAIKHSTENSEIKVYGEVKDNKNYVYIKNKCNPLTDEELVNIWHRFYKTDKSHNRDNGGTGLGLAIVKAILEVHEFDYGVNNCNDGVIFYFAVDLSIKD
ncbi:HAMP domain-containing histidine kinase [Clostridium sp. 'deep sea']|uniref:sensor histidine kinase n=1 Tax=Clostridium sp. 'deep sea' TaxID=2779445 RepID=UPI00189650DF|nr:HAMP domain-containing sensor histidine kinase [Clostridium sp. 'deep sea']QOR35500.1 HAMP domain-containing histidine kinase [Clostridium sp. 'deep sea']